MLTARLELHNATKIANSFRARSAASATETSRLSLHVGRVLRRRLQISTQQLNRLVQDWEAKHHLAQSCFLTIDPCWFPCDFVSGSCKAPPSIPVSLLRKLCRGLQVSTPLNLGGARNIFFDKQDCGSGMRFHESVRSFKYLPFPSFSNVLRPISSPTRLSAQ